MSHRYLLTLEVFLTAVLPCFTLNAASSWKYVGLKGEKINTLYHLPNSEENAIMVGTDKGIWWFEYGTWWENGGFTSKPLGLPVYSITTASTGNLLAVAGNGSDSDGVYLGKVTAIGEPGTCYGFSLLVKWPKPTALTCTGLDGGCTDKVYVGNVNGVATGLLCNKAIDSLKVMTCPQNPFGIRCASLMFSPTEFTLYAGGYGDYMSFSETGARDTAMLLKGGSELAPLKKIDVTSIIEFSSVIESSSQNETLVVVATVDSGIQLFKNGVFHSFLPAPNRGEPVLSIVPFASWNFSGGKWTMLVAATPHGVYGQCMPYEDCVWTLLSGLPGTPRCLEQFQGRILWAATDSGVYRYDIPTALVRHNIPAGVAPIRVSAIRGPDGVVKFDFGGNDLANAALHVFDLQGRRCVVRREIAGNQVEITDARRGMFLYRVIRDGCTVSYGSVMCH
ncbi:MAG: hypothetical protein JW913_04215 [Chitinispirillaceae bacterium]|nr:hypothetical protein [Chitinispirillaceae bacterium]